MDEGHCIERAHRSHCSESECPCSTHAGHHMRHLNAVPPIRPGILMASADEPMLQCLAVPRLTRHQVRALNDVQAGESETRLAHRAQSRSGDMPTRNGIKSADVCTPDQYLPEKGRRERIPIARGTKKLHYVPNPLKLKQQRALPGKYRNPVRKQL